MGFVQYNLNPLELEPLGVAPNDQRDMLSRLRRAGPENMSVVRSNRRQHLLETKVFPLIPQKVDHDLLLVRREQPRQLLST